VSVAAVPVSGSVMASTADGKYSPVENGQDALVFVVVFAVLIAALWVAFRKRR
jgi:hypothetical protein